MNQNNSYYWLCSYPLEGGSIISPGNWGRIISLYAFDTNNLNQIRERVFEKVRTENYPDRPSRLKSTYLCKDIDGARQFLRDTNRRFDLIYEVEVLEQGKPLFTTDWKRADHVDGESESLMIIRAHNYWKAEDVAHPEVLTESRIKIVRRIEI